MSYCRYGEDSDVYLIRHVNGNLVCYCCLEGNESERPEEMISHLLVHRKMGHKVPERALERLQDERMGIPHATDVEQALGELFPGLTRGRDPV